MRSPLQSFVVALLIASAVPASAAGLIRIGAAEKVYADIAAQIGGSAVAVDLLQRPLPEMHASPDRSAAGAGRLDIVICNGMGYDGWVNGVLAHSGLPPVVMEAGRYLPPGAGQRSFAWYDFKATDALARALAAELSRRDAADNASFSSKLQVFEAGLKPLDRKLEEIAAVYAGSEILMADNLYRSVVDALRLKVQDEGILKSLGTRSEPDAKGMAALRRALDAGGASILIYNSEAKSAAMTELISLANDKGLPVVGVREREPAGLNYQQWMLRQLNIIHGALNEAAP